GLTQMEKADVGYLLQSAKRHCNSDDAERRERWERDEERAWKLSVETGRPFEEVVEWSRSPLWQPDMERIMQQWMDGIESDAVSSEAPSEATRKSNTHHHWVNRPLIQEEIQYITFGNRKPCRFARTSLDPENPKTTV